MQPSGTLQRRHLYGGLATLALHVLIIVGWLMSGGSGVASMREAPAVEVVALPNPVYPKLRSSAPPPRLIKVDALNPPMPVLLLNASSADGSAPASSGNGVGASVDWMAEWRRALRAHEIRVQNSSYVSGNAAAHDWWPETHRPGDQYKMPNGDWIVWIDSNCYRVAGADPKGLAGNAPSAKIACRDETSANP